LEKFPLKLKKKGAVSQNCPIYPDGLESSFFFFLENQGGLLKYSGVFIVESNLLAFFPGKGKDGKTIRFDKLGDISHTCFVFVKSPWGRKLALFYLKECGSSWSRFQTLFFVPSENFPSKSPHLLVMVWKRNTTVV